MLLLGTFISASQPQPDSVVAVVADEQGLTFVPTPGRPAFGTYWEARNSLPCLGAPLPCAPFDPNTPVYAIGGGHFLADATVGPLLAPLASPYRGRVLGAADYAAIVQAQVQELQAFVTRCSNV